MTERKKKISRSPTISRKFKHKLGIYYLTILESIINSMSSLRNQWIVVDVTYTMGPNNFLTSTFKNIFPHQGFHEAFYEIICKLRYCEKATKFEKFSHLF